MTKEKNTNEGSDVGSREERISSGPTFCSAGLEQNPAEVIEFRFIGQAYALRFLNEFKDKITLLSLHRVTGQQANSYDVMVVTRSCKEITSNLADPDYGLVSLAFVREAGFALRR